MKFINYEALTDVLKYVLSGGIIKIFYDISLIEIEALVFSLVVNRFVVVLLGTYILSKLIYHVWHKLWQYQNPLSLRKSKDTSSLPLAQ